VRRVGHLETATLGERRHGIGRLICAGVRIDEHDRNAPVVIGYQLVETVEVVRIEREGVARKNNHDTSGIRFVTECEGRSADDIPGGKSGYYLAVSGPEDKRKDNHSESHLAASG